MKNYGFLTKVDLALIARLDTVGLELEYEPQLRQNLDIKTFIYILLSVQKLAKNSRFYCLMLISIV
jgi:hypothetical protein